MKREKRKYISRTPEETMSIGETIAASLEPGNVISFTGSLGAGKTTLIKGIARGMGIEEDVTSPSYTIISEYDAKIPLYHMDLYRIGSIEEFEYLGTDEMVYGDGITVIEWGERASEVLPEERISVTIEIDRDGRRIIIIDTPVIKE